MPPRGPWRPSKTPSSAGGTRLRVPSAPTHANLRPTSSSGVASRGPGASKTYDFLKENIEFQEITSSAGRARSPARMNTSAVEKGPLAVPRPLGPKRRNIEGFSRATLISSTRRHPMWGRRIRKGCALCRRPRKNKTSHSNSNFNQVKLEIPSFSTHRFQI